MVKDDSKMDKIEKAVNDFGGLIREFRVQHSLSLADMSELVSISSSYLWRVEKKTRNIELDTKIRVLTLGMNWTIEDVHLYLDRILSKEETK